MFEVIDYKWALAGIAALISFCNLLYYLWTVTKGKTKPHMYSWLIWGIVTLVAAIAQITNEGGAGGIFTFLVGFNCLAIAGLAFFKGTKDIKKTDTICLIFCLVAIALWPLTEQPLLSLLIVTLVDLVGFVPTYRKSFNSPDRENIFSFLIYGITYSLSIIALGAYSILTILYPAAIVIASWGLVAFLSVRRYQLGHKIFA